MTMEKSDLIQLLRDLDHKLESNFRDLRSEVSDLKDEVRDNTERINLKLAKHDSIFDFVFKFITPPGLALGIIAWCQQNIFNQKP